MSGTAEEEAGGREAGAGGWAADTTGEGISGANAGAMGMCSLDTTSLGVLKGTSVNRTRS